MDATAYTTLARQSGLMREMQAVANNIANASTTGFRREGVVFSEYIRRLEDAPSLSMAHASARHLDLSEGGLTRTGAAFDMAIRGEGFFLVQTPDGQRLTRAGSFTPDAGGILRSGNGDALLDAGGAEIVLDPAAGPVALAEDGTLSAGGAPVAQVGLWRPTDPLALRHVAGTMFDPGGAVEPAEGGRLLQGYLEESNVEPVSEIARMITVQRAYELGQSFLEAEDGRVRGLIQTLGR